MIRAFLLTLAGILIVLALLCLCSCGTTRAERVQLGTLAATAAGRPDIAAGITALGYLAGEMDRLEAKQPRSVQP